MSTSILRHLILFLFVCMGCHGQYYENLSKIINSPEAEEIKQQKIDSFLSLNTSKIDSTELANCYNDLGLYWYYKKWKESGNPSAVKNAIQYTQKALLIKRKLNSLESCSVNRTLYNLGVFYTKNSNIYDAISIYLEIIRKGRDYCKDNARDDKILISRSSLSKLYMITGDFFKALKICEKIISDLTIQESLDDYDRRILIYAYIKIAEIYSLIDTKNYSKKIKANLEQSDFYLKESSIACCRYENQINQLEGNRLLRTGKYLPAIKSHKEVIKRLPVNLPINFAIAYNSIAISYSMIEEYEFAYENLQNAISYDPFYSQTYENLGNLYVARRNFGKGLAFYQKAINYAIDSNLNLGADQLPTAENLEISPKKIPLLNHIVAKGNGWIKYYEHDSNKEHLSHALQTFTLADQLIDMIRFESTEQQSKLFWREQGAVLYMKAIEVCYLLNKPQEAYHFMERNKALLLLEDLTQEEAKEIAQLPKEAMQREFQLKRSIHLAENDLLEADDTTTDGIVALKDTIMEHKYRYESYIDSLNEAYPEYAKFQRKVEILPFKELIANHVSGDEAVLHYILNEEQGYGLLSSADTTLLFKLENPSKLNWDIEVLIHRLSNGRSDQETFNALAHTVFENLIPEKVYSEIKGKLLTIIPDYTLQRIPFETLVVDTTDLKYLLEDVEIGYVYSMSLLDRAKRSNNEPAKDLLGVAPVQFAGLGLAELNFSKGEISDIANVFEGDIFLNGRASKANFIDQVGNHKIIHLSTHADMGDGENPWIAFSDSKMYLKEIYATKNRSDMVVLSACNTSNGNLKRGEGLMSLARGFFYSGAKSVVSSLWPITDDTGKDLMIDFYKNLDKGYSKSKALREAKLAYLENTEEEELKHPFYWAGFVVVGDNAPVASGPYWYWVVLVVGVLMLLTYIFRSRLFQVKTG